MLHGLSATGQLGAATSVLSAYLAQQSSSSSSGGSGASKPADGRQSPEERLSAIVLNGCAEEGRMDLSGVVLSALRKRAVPLTSLTYCILFKGYGRAGDVARVRKLHSAIMKMRSVELDLPTYNAWLDALARNGDLRTAEAVLAQMPTQGVMPSVRSYNILIHGHGHKGRLRDAFGMVAKLRKELGPSAPNDVTYSTLVHAVRCAWSSQ